MLFSWQAGFFHTRSSHHIQLILTYLLKQPEPFDPIKSLLTSILSIYGPIIALHINPLSFHTIATRPSV